MSIKPELMTELEQRAMQLGRRMGESREMCEALAASELLCSEAFSGVGGTNSSTKLIEQLSAEPFSLSRYSAAF